MRKITVYLLLMALLICVFSACDNTSEDTSSLTSSEITSEEGSDIASESDDASSLTSSDITSEKNSDTSSESDTSNYESSIAKKLFRYCCFEDITVWQDYNRIFGIECAEKTQNGKTLFVINNKEDLEIFTSQIPYNETQISENSLEFLGFIKSHNEDFFEEQSLLISIFEHNNNGFEYELNSVIAEDGTLKLEYFYRTITQVAESALTKYYVITEIKKDDISDCEEFVVDCVHDPLVSFEYNVQMIEGKFKDSESSNCQKYIMPVDNCEIEPYIMQNEYEANAFLALLDENYIDTTDFIKNLPEGYFNDNLLIANAYVLPSSGFQYEVSDVCRSTNHVAVFYNCYYPMPDTAVTYGMNYDFSFIELKKSDLGDRGIYAKVNSGW